MPTILKQGDRDQLIASGITEKTWRRNGVYSAGAKRAATLLNRQFMPSGGLVFPFRDLDGEVNGHAIVRPHHPRRVDGKPVKYESPIDESPRAYFPAESVEMIQAGEAVVITEGPKKALALAQLDLAAIGLSGVWNWKRKDEEELIENLEAIDWNGRNVAIVFDWDPKEETREHVAQAKRRLAAALRKAGAAEVFDIELPPGENGEKQGVDDFLVAHGREEFDKLVENATPIRDGGINLINLISFTTPELPEACYHGLAGEFVRAVRDDTEATDAGILGHLLTACGIYLGPRPFVWTGKEEPARVNLVLVGPTSTGRKGTSWEPVRRLMKYVDSDFWSTQVRSGLSSGEGIIVAVEDKKRTDNDGYEELVTVDKRVFVLEPEFSKVLTMSQRSGNILSVLLRECFDSGDLATMTITPRSAEGAHISVVAHITPEELKQKLSEIEMANGFGNRFLWFAVKSDKVISDPKPFDEAIFERLGKRLRIALNRARGFKSQSRYARTAEAQEYWDEIYRQLRQDQPGLAGAMLARGPSIVLRLALIYTILDGATEIGREHLEAAMGVWEYNEMSVKQLFGRHTGNSLAERLYRLIESRHQMKKTEMFKHLKADAREIDNALQSLITEGRVRQVMQKPKGPGRPSEVFEAVEG